MAQSLMVQSVCQPRGSTVPPPNRAELFAILRKKIDDGDEGYRPENKLPTQTALAAEYKIHRATVQRAIEDLIAAGLVVTRGRQGTYVIERPTNG